MLPDEEPIADDLEFPQMPVASRLTRRSAWISLTSKTSNLLRK